MKTDSLTLLKNSNILDVKVKSYNECGYCSDPENRIELNVPWEIYTEWLYLSNQVGEKEWAGVFTIKDGTVADFKIPEQEISSASVEFKEELGGNGIVHSHHGMGAFHSGQDERHCRNLYDYSIVVSNGKGYVASKRIELPCKAFGYLDVELIITGIPAGIDLSKITEKVYKQPEHNQNSQYHHPDLIPDDPVIEDITIDDMPCFGCTLPNCNECPFVDGNLIEEREGRS